MVKDVVICATIIFAAAVLGIFVHPLLWCVAVLAIAWLVGRDRTVSSNHAASRSSS